MPNSFLQIRWKSRPAIRGIVRFLVDKRRRARIIISCAANAARDTNGWTIFVDINGSSAVNCLDTRAASAIKYSTDDIVSLSTLWRSTDEMCYENRKYDNSQGIVLEADDLSGDCTVPFQTELGYFFDGSSIVQSIDTNIHTQKSKTTGKGMQFFCTGCERSYTRPDSLKRHQQKCNDFLTSLEDHRQYDGQQYYCTQCGKSYRRRDTLQRHQRLVCGAKEKQSSCNICQKKFAYKFLLKKHLEQHENQPKSVDSTLATIIPL